MTNQNTSDNGHQVALAPKTGERVRKSQHISWSQEGFDGSSESIFD